MRPTDILSGEHRVIETMLDVLESICTHAHQTGALNREDANSALTFIRLFADKCHHGKEEGQLFPAMEAKGVPCESGPIGVMLSEHEQGRRFVGGMAEHLESAAAGDHSALQAFVNNAHGYILLLRAHIMKEDTILFPMAARLLSNEEAAALLEQFEHVESDHMGTGTHEKFLELADRLADKYEIEKRWTAASTTCGCSHNR